MIDSSQKALLALPVPREVGHIVRRWRNPLSDDLDHNIAKVGMASAKDGSKSLTDSNISEMRDGITVRCTAGYLR
jgi:hypothetical protein